MSFGGGNAFGSGAFGSGGGAFGSGGFGSDKDRSGSNTFCGGGKEGAFGGGDNKAFGGSGGVFGGGCNAAFGDGGAFGGESTAFGSSGGGGAFGGSSSGGWGSGGGGGGNNNCFNCNQPGHRSAECPEPRKPRGGGMSCYNCGKEGHRSADCSEPRKPREGGGGGGQCYNCQQTGHMSRDCPEPRKPREPRGDFGGGGAFGQSNGGAFGGSGGDGWGSSGNAFGSGAFGGEKAGGDGGFGAWGGKSGGGGGGGSGCFNCGQEGHRSADCPEPRKPREGGDGTCFNCGQRGHRSTECTEERKPRIGEDGKPIVVSTYVPEDTKADTLFEHRIETGALFEKFFDAKVQVTRGGNPATDSYKEITSFDQVNLTDTIRANVERAGYKKPTPIQRHAIPLIAAGADLMGCAQTGSGKTAAFLLPVMHKLVETGNLDTGAAGVCKPRCVIMAPTRELAIQIYNEALKLANNTIVSCAIAYGGTAVAYQRDKVRRGATILVGTTGRLKHFVNESFVDLEEVRYVILDEADRMLDMGFSSDVEELLSNPRIPPKEERQTLMFSATFDDSVQRLASQHLRSDFVMVTIDAIGSANKCITQEFIMCDRSEKKTKLLEILQVDLDSYTVSKESDFFKKKTLVFVDRKTFADTLGGILSQAGLPAMTIHGDRLQQQREQALRDFRSGRTPVLIATAVAERGLDINGVDHVINYDLPQTRDEYVHRIGRTGRVGNAGRATSFFDPDKDMQLAPFLVQVLAEVEQVVPDFLQQYAGVSGGNAGFVVPNTTAAGNDEW